MTKSIFLLVFLAALSLTIFAQGKTPSDKVHRIVFHLATDDTTVHRGLMKQLNNILIAAPDSKIEVVAHGPGITMLMRDSTLVLEKIQLFKAKGVIFYVCENTLRDKGISKDRIIAEAGFVPSALIEIVTRQEEGWSYIKAGF